MPKFLLFLGLFQHKRTLLGYHVALQFFTGDQNIYVMNSTKPNEFIENDQVPLL